MRWNIRSIFVVTLVVALLLGTPIRYRSLLWFSCSFLALCTAGWRYKLRGSRSSLVILVVALFAVYALSIGPVNAARFYARNYGKLPESRIDTFIHLSYEPIVVLSDSIGMGRQRSAYILQWHGYFWPKT